MRPRTREAVAIDSLKQVEEIDAVLGEIFKVGLNHANRAFKHAIEDAGDLRGHISSQLGNDGCHQRQDLGISRIGDVGLVVAENSV